MPESNGPRWKIEPHIAALYVGELLGRKYGLLIKCDSCQHQTNWSNEFLKRWLKRYERKRMHEVASRLRCGKCRGNHVRIVEVKEASALKFGRMLD